MIVVLVIYVLLAIAETYLVLSFSFTFKSSHSINHYSSNVSVLVCARNEEENLPVILQSLLSSDYDLGQVEILVGNDHSTDSTQQVLNHFAQKHDNIIPIYIEEGKDGLIAKANVLAQLLTAAKHEKVLIIDADMRVSKGWLQQMTHLLNENDLISGLTMVDKSHYQPRVQFFDWAVTLHSMKAMADGFRPISILGNNMGFNRSAYEQVGGFEALGPTDVEDLGLLRRFQSFGLKTFQYVGQEGIAFTVAQKEWKEMLWQRCRWMNGVFTHHWLLGLPALFARLWLLVALLLIPFSTEMSCWIVLYGLLFNSIKYFQLTVKANHRYIFALYLPPIISLLDTFALVRILLFGKVSWKGRVFKK